MRLFLSYATEHREKAYAICLRLRQAHHQVFFDKDALPVGRAYDDRIRQALSDSDGLIFLISPGSIEPGRYTLTELEFAKKRWENPDGHLLPVLIEPTPHQDIPTYLKSVTILEPKGNVEAETAAAVESALKASTQSDDRVAGIEDRSRRMGSGILSGMGAVLLGVSFYAAFVLPILGPCVVVVDSLNNGQSNAFTEAVQGLGLTPIFNAVRTMGIHPRHYLEGLFGGFGAVVGLVARFHKGSEQMPFWRLFGQGLLLPVFGSLSAVIVCSMLRASGILKIAGQYPNAAEYLLSAMAGFWMVRAVTGWGNLRPTGT